MGIKVHLYKDSNCELCKIMQSELVANPPSCDLEIHHVKHDYTKDIIDNLNIKKLPCTIIIDEDSNVEIARLTGFISSKVIDNIIEDYEKKIML